LRKKLDNLAKSIEEVNNDLKNLAAQTLQHVSLSMDQVSKALASLFNQAVIHTSEDMILNMQENEGREEILPVRSQTL
jgi:hypothetical protein